ncbi:MAG: hypothetical protein CEE40_02415 [Chloroflexi bacterium B3_Chlor]|nr:MAG: hypothetical protein CEE40_02415 [Chloroflexi bacterium B3_Chlor]
MNESRLKWMLVVSSVVLWAFAVYRWYHVIHEPFAGSFVPAALDRPANLAIWMTLLLLAGAPGRRVLRSTLAAPSAEELVFSVGLGVGVLSFGAPLLGTTGILVHWLSWALFVVLLVLHPRSALRFDRTQATYRRKPASRDTGQLTAPLCQGVPTGGPIAASWRLVRVASRVPRTLISKAVGRGTFEMMAYR